MFKKIRKSGVVAVLVIDEIENAVPLANALLENGITAMELTLRTPAAVGALKEIKRAVPEMLAGIGTVLTPEQIEEVVLAEADFAVSPGLNPRVVKKAQELSLPFAPGIATPSDIELAIELGCRTLKFFPAESMGGLNYLRSMATPYQHLGLEYIPLGGLNLDNIRSYFESPLVSAIGGSWIAPRNLIHNKEWGTIAQNAKQAGRIIEEYRK